MSSLYTGFDAFDIPTESSTVIHGICGGSGPPLLLLHGFPQTHMIWHKVAAELASIYTLVIIDLRGYGASSKPAVNYSEYPSDHSLYAKSAMARDCVVVMTKLGFDSFFVCGHDRGGRVAHKLCIDHPARIRKCMVLDICPTKAMYEATNMGFAYAYWHWFFLTQPAPFPEKLMMTTPEIISDKCFNGDHFNETAMFAYTKQFTDWDSAHAMCEEYRASMQEDIEESKADIAAERKIKSPFMVLWGKQGVIEGYFDAKVEWEKVCGLGLFDMQSCALDCGHFIPEEAPQDLLEHIKKFFV